VISQSDPTISIGAVVFDPIAHHTRMPIIDAGFYVD
jgi:hypothetical protein